MEFTKMTNLLYWHRTSYQWWRTYPVDFCYRFSSNLSILSKRIQRTFETLLDFRPNLIASIFERKLGQVYRKLEEKRKTLYWLWTLEPRTDESEFSNLTFLHISFELDQRPNCIAFEKFYWMLPLQRLTLTETKSFWLIILKGSLNKKKAPPQFECS